MGYSAVLIGVARPHPAYAAAGRAIERKTVCFSGCSLSGAGLRAAGRTREPPLLGRRNSNFSHPHAERTVWFSLQFAREICSALPAGRRQRDQGCPSASLQSPPALRLPVETQGGYRWSLTIPMNCSRCIA